MYTKVFVVLIAFIGAHFVVAVDWSTCNSTAGKTTNVVVDGCTKARCPLKRGTNASLSITFDSYVTSDKLTAVVYGEVIGIKSKFNLPNPDACNGVGINCPIKPDQSYVYTNTLPVKQHYPKLTVDIWWEIKNENGDLVECSIIPAQIV